MQKLGAWDYVWSGSHFSILIGMIFEKVTFEQSPEGVGEFKIQLEGTTRANAIRRKCAKGIGSSAQRLIWLEGGE